MGWFVLILGGIVIWMYFKKTSEKQKNDDALTAKVPIEETPQYQYIEAQYKEIQFCKEQEDILGAESFYDRPEEMKAYMKYGQRKARAYDNIDAVKGNPSYRNALLHYEKTLSDNIYKASTEVKVTDDYWIKKQEENIAFAES